MANLVLVSMNFVLGFGSSVRAGLKLYKEPQARMYLLPLLIPLLERYIDGNFPIEGSIEPKFKLPHIHAANDSGFIEEETTNIPDL